MILRFLILALCLLSLDVPRLPAEPVAAGPGGGWQPAITPEQYEARNPKKTEPPLSPDEQKEIVAKIQQLEEKIDFFAPSDTREKILSDSGERELETREDLDGDGRVTNADRNADKARKMTAQEGRDWNEDGRVDLYDVLVERKAAERERSERAKEVLAKQPEATFGTSAETPAHQTKAPERAGKSKEAAEKVVDQNAGGNDKLLRLVLATAFKGPVPQGRYDKLFARPSDRFVFMLQMGLTDLAGKLLQARKQTQRKSFDPEILVRKELLPDLKNPPELEPGEGPPSLLADETGYVSVESVSVDKALAAAHFLMNPPQSLHPFLRVLFYRRIVTPEIAYWYFATLEKIRTIYEEAKEGKGQIRYKGKICDAYLPLPDEMGGPFELVVPNKTERQASEYAAQADL